MTGKTSRALAALATLLLALVLTPTTAHAVLERVGPNRADNFLPAWYQDSTGITFDFCTPTTQAELDGGWCLILPADVPSGTAPETFPGDFAGEHFYWGADAGGDWTYTPAVGEPAPPFTTGRVVFVQAIEAAFLGDIGPGLGTVFGRVRIRILDLPVTGTYKVYMPWGIKEIPGVAGGRIFDTEDIGTACAPFTYDCALQTSIGPFLLPADAPGGNELPPVVGPSGGLFISNPGDTTPVTGSPVAGLYTLGDGTTMNPNGLAIEAPNGQVIFRTNLFTTIGRYYNAPIPSRVAVERASYTRSLAGDVSVDVYATGEPTITPRLPPALPSVPELPVLEFFDAPCVGTPHPPTPADPLGIGPPWSAPAGTSVPMSSYGTHFNGHSTPAAVPAGVCIVDLNARDAGGLLVPQYQPAPLGDQVFISEAIFDSQNGGSLSVKASSSDRFAPPILSVGAFGLLAGNVPLTNGAVVVGPVAAVPSKIRVLSQEGGVSEVLVSAGRQAATGVTLFSTPSAIQFVNNAVLFTAQGQGSTGYQYRFWLSSDGGVNYAMIQDWSASATYSLPSTTPVGTYSVFADVRANETSLTPDASSAAVSVSIRLPAATGVSITADRTSPAAVLVSPSPTVFTAAGEGSSGYDYRFSLSTNGGPFALVQNYGVGATWTMPASTPVGNYQVKVDVRTSALVDLDATNTLGFQLVAPTKALGVTLTPSPASPSATGANVVFTAVGSGSTSAGAPTPPEGYAYRFFLKIGTGAFTMVQDYGVGSTYTLVAPADGTYQVAAHVRTTNTVAADVFGAALVHVVGVPAPVPTRATGVTLTPSPVSPSAAGTDILLTAVGTGSTTGGVPSAPSAYQYRFFVKVGAAAFVMVQDYGVGSTYTITAPAAGSYQYAVHVRTSTTVAADVFGPALGHVVQ